MPCTRSSTHVLPYPAMLRNHFFPMTLHSDVCAVTQVMATAAKDVLWNGGSENLVTVF